MKWYNTIIGFCEQLKITSPPPTLGSTKTMRMVTNLFLMFQETKFIRLSLIKAINIIIVSFRDKNTGM
jgi:hypothetical protein